MRKEVYQNIARNFGITPEQAKVFVAFHNGIRADLNEAHAAMTVAPRVELNKTAAGEVGSAVAQGVLSFIPLVGNLASTAAAIAIEKGDRAYQMQGYKNLAEFSPRKDQSEWCLVSRETADLMTIAMQDQLKGMTKEQARELAGEQSVKMIDAITNGDLKGVSIDDEESLQGLIEAAAPGKFSPKLGETAAQFRETFDAIDARPSSTFKPVGMKPFHAPSHSHGAAAAA